MMPNLRAGAGHDPLAGAAEAAAANRERRAVVSCMFGGEFEMISQLERKNFEAMAGGEE